MSFKQKMQYTKRSDYWNTPKELYDHIINKLNYIDYNPKMSFISPFNKDTYKYKNKNIYINPPFSLLGKQEMYDTLVELLQNDNIVLLLIPARTDTKYFHKFLELQPHIIFIKGRLSFNDKGSAPFPSILLGFSNVFTYNEYSTINRDGEGL